MLWLFALPLLLPLPGRAASGPASPDLAAAVAEDSNASLRSNLLARIEFQELNLQLAGIATIGGTTSCYIKHPGTGQPMSYHVGDVIGGYRIQSVEKQSVCFERNGLRFWLQPDEKAAMAAKSEQPAAKTRQALMDEIESAKAIKEVETITAGVNLKKRTKKYAIAKVIEDAAKVMPARRISTGRSFGMFMLPMPGNLTSPYGYRRHPMGGGEKFHRGIDIANREG
ncbi:MAG: hypothetical protein LLG00_15435, partial [Planctomycetaceae bacterium]|nr:hypothetical protein [Planctomycetaceae bacterium]